MVALRKVVRIREDLEIPLAEIRLTFSRSGGPGGQHVNKVETGVLLSFDVEASSRLTEPQRELIMSRLRNRIAKDGVLHLSESAGRSQWKNRQRIIERFAAVLAKALEVRKPRLKTRPGTAARRGRLQAKGIQSARKAARKRPSPDADQV